MVISVQTMTNVTKFLITPAVALPDGVTLGEIDGICLVTEGELGQRPAFENRGKEVSGDRGTIEERRIFSPVIGAMTFAGDHGESFADSVLPLHAFIWRLAGKYGSDRFHVLGDTCVFLFGKREYRLLAEHMTNLVITGR